MNEKALVVIDIQNDITKHYRVIIENINSAVDWAMKQAMTVIYIKHNNLSAGTRTFKPGTKGAELAPAVSGVPLSQPGVRSQTDLLCCEPG